MTVCWLGNNLEIDAITQISREIAFGIPYVLMVNGLVYHELNVKEVWRSNVLQHLGISSFSLYLTHYLTIVILVSLGVFGNCPSWLRFILIVILCMLVSELAYLLIEKNVIQVGKKLLKLN